MKHPAPGRRERKADELAARDEHGAAKFRLDAFNEAAHTEGIHVERSQIQHICLSNRANQVLRRTVSLRTMVPQANPIFGLELASLRVVEYGG